MRPIKFRAWYKPTNKLLCSNAVESINFETKVIGAYFEYAGYKQLRMSDFEIMQFTGLKDCNGKEIYEGDIVSYESVYIDPIIGGTQIKKVMFSSGEFHPEGVSGWGHSGTVKVIGNIYENPELMEHE